MYNREIGQYIWQYDNSHCLSSIKECDRILMLDKGYIIEDSSYTELIDKGGYFAQLVACQQLDDTQSVSKTMLIVTHEMAFAREVASRVPYFERM